MTAARAWLVPCLVTLCLFAAACRREEAVVVYVSADEAVARPLLASFTERTGIPVAPLFDTEATKTTGLAQRLRAEANRPRADVFWSSEIAQTIALTREGVFETMHSPALDSWPAAFRDPEGRWYAFAARARVIAYSTDRVSPDDVPKTWMALVRERWRGRVAMADPRFGTTRTHMGAMRAHWNATAMPGFFAAWLDGLAENRVRVVTSGNSGVIEAIEAGEADVGMTDTDDVWAAQARGAHIGLVYPRHAVEDAMRGGGTLLIPNTVAVVRGTTHADSARALVEFLLSPDGERLLMRSDSRNIPLGPTLADEAAALRPPDPLDIDWGAASDATDAAVKQAMAALAPRESR
ncbi:MAG: extracellular solute-binding protein [Phycisphaerales bacterium]